jgi:hypothetical protein
VPEVFIEEAPEADEAHEADDHGEGNDGHADDFADEASDEPEEDHHDAAIPDGSNEQDYVQDHRSNNEHNTQGNDEDPRSASDEPEDAYDTEAPMHEDAQGPNETEAPVDEDAEEPAKVDPRTATQIRHNLRPNRQRNYNHRLGHIMDDPASNESYDTQFLQSCEEEDSPPALREGVEEMQRTGSNTAVHKYIMGHDADDGKGRHQETWPSRHRCFIHRVLAVA